MVDVHVNVPENFHMLIAIVYSCSVAISSGESRGGSWLLRKIFLYASASTVLLMGELLVVVQTYPGKQAKNSTDKKIFTLCAEYICTYHFIDWPHALIDWVHTSKKDQDNLWKFPCCFYCSS